MPEKKNIPSASNEILGHPYVQYLHGLIEQLVLETEKNKDRIDELESELRRLKKQPKKPKIKPSQLDEQTPSGPKQKDTSGKRPGSEKRKKKKDLPIDETKQIKAEGVPRGWKLIGYKPYVVQDVIVRRNNIKYEREIWQSPDGKEQMVAAMPASLKGRSFGASLRRYVISLYNECHVTQPIIYAHLQNIGVDISTGQINFILNEDKANAIFEEELLEAVELGISQSKEIRTDDTAARHKGQNGFCNCINTDLFTYFVSSSTKSRINFLELLQVRHKEYHFTDVALSYCEEQNLSPKYMDLLSKETGLIIMDEASLEAFFHSNKVRAKYAKRTITEALLIGSLVARGFDQDKVIHSDGAGQFNVFNHALCWKHAERPLKKLFIHNEVQQKQWNDKMGQYWQLYQDLKAYKQVSRLARKRRKAKLENRFDDMCEEVDNFAALTCVLEGLKEKKTELLLVLDYPFTSLHNNSSERQIREYAKRRKISGSTRSNKGRKSRDVFTSLKKTCPKLGVNFWDYLLDRIEGKNEIPRLADIILHRSQANPT